MTVTSDTEKGSIFNVYLPAIKPEKKSLSDFIE